MVGHEEDKFKEYKAGGNARQREKLPYVIELWQPDDTSIVDQTLGRAISWALARTIFEAACTEYPERRITLRRGKRLISDSVK